jgi:hypothetical protein
LNGPKMACSNANGLVSAVDERSEWAAALKTL